MVDYPTVYNGSEPYIFVSYAHKDADTVMPIVTGLSERGFRVWYDAGIETGSEWPEYIAERLASCGCAIVMITEAALESQNCRREIHYAINRKVPILVVYLEDVKMSPGMEMQLGVLQAIFRSRHAHFDSFMERLCASALLKPCGVGEVVAAPVGVPCDRVISEPKTDNKTVLSAEKPKWSQTEFGFSRVKTFVFLCGVMAVLGFSGIGYIPLASFQISLMPIPVIIGGIMLGPGAGALLGAVMGLLSVWDHTVNPSLLSFLLSPFMAEYGAVNVIGALWISMGCRVLFGAIAGWLWRLAGKLKTKEFVAMTLPVVSALAAAVHGLLVTLSALVLMSCGEIWGAISVQTYYLGMSALAASGVSDAILAAVAVLVVWIVLRVLSRRKSSVSAGMK